MNKSPQAFRTISEVAEALGIPAHVLRFWESRFPQLRPMKSSGGRRYYRPEDVELLRGIRELLYDDGLTIKGVQKVLREQGVRAVIARGLEAADAVAPEAGEAESLLADDIPADAGDIGAEGLWDDAEIDALVDAPQAEAEAAVAPAARPGGVGAAETERAPVAAPGAEQRRAKVRDAIARLEAVRARILRELGE
ncbi:MAG TPA: MerR family transcriptional regulator [Paracoccaceae bacterium]|nr:MerR family transcriptional regulator [Paracoccaceae bacterium]